MSKPITLKKLICQELADGDSLYPRELSQILATPLRVIHTKLSNMTKDGQLLAEGTPKRYKLNPEYVAPPTSLELQLLAKKAKAENYAANAVKSTYQPDRMGTTYVPPKLQGIRNV